jgi:hypothetical protein
VEKQVARKWYWWLWLSPLVTLLLLGWLATLLEEMAVTPLTILGSALPHLILLVPALNKKNEFVRWHGRQALLLAGLRTLVPLVFVAVFGSSGKFELLAVPILVLIWSLGTVISQVQASRGLCALMRWFGRADAQPAYWRAK